jgi:hypothetical protein
LLLVNLLFFWPHYRGWMTFPWDFLGGYHAMTVGMLRDGSFFNPPRWFPYADAGFPAAWAIQDGEFYLPLHIFHFFGGHYTIAAAARIQALHVLVGGVGTYVWLRVLGIRRAGATIGGLVFQLSVCFYGNAEHVDIVRGAALLPWLLHATTPDFLNARRPAPAWGALVLFQFLVASYPGIIVAASYTVLLLVLFDIYKLSGSKARCNFFVRLTVVGLAGSLMALVKWLPIVANVSDLEVKSASIAGFYWQQLVTLIFHFGPPLQGEITMQSIWMPPIAVLFLPFVDVRNLLVQKGLLMLGFGLVCAFVLTSIPAVRQHLPLLSMSRMVISDWRSTYTLGGCLLVGTGVQQLAGSAPNGWQALRGVILASICLVAILFLALYVGYRWSEVRVEFFCVCATGLIAAAVLRISSLHWRESCLFAVLAVSTIGTGLLEYLAYNPTTWRVPWSARSEIEAFGEPVAISLNQRQIDFWPRRPARFYRGTDPSNLASQNDAYNNRAWYAQEFAMFGYTNAALKQTKLLLDSVTRGPAAAQLMEFMQHPSQAILLGPGQAFDPGFAAACEPAHDSCGVHTTATLKIESFRRDGATFRIRAPQDVLVVENEVAMSGWTGQLCGQRDCQSVLMETTKGFLRSWAVPAGDWTLRTQFHTVNGAARWYAFAAGLLLGALSFGMRPLDEQSAPFTCRSRSRRAG